MNATALTLEQILNLSDISWLFKFIYLHPLPSILIPEMILIVIIPLFSAITKRKNTEKIIAFSFSASVLFIISMMIALACMDSIPLNESQIQFIKSIDSPEFQFVMTESIQKHEATLKAIKITLNFCK